MVFTVCADGTFNSAVPATFSLVFAIPTRVDGESMNATVPGQDGTIGGATKYESGSDGIVRTDEDEGDDA